MRTGDANMEMWLYQIPAYTAADLSSGEELPVTNLSGGSYTRVTNTLPSRLPQGGTIFSGASVAEDNHDASIDDDGSTIAFVSTRNLIADGNTFPDNDNDEIFTYTQSGGATITQLTQTPRGLLSNPIYNKNPTISGDGSRVVFVATSDDPVPLAQPTPIPSPSPSPSQPPAFDCGSNPLASRNEEIFVANLDPTTGVPTGCRQVTTTTPTNPGDIVNVLDLGKRMSRNGRYIAFDSYADLANEHSGTNQTAFATFLYDYTANSFRRIIARSAADSEATGGDVQRYPGFTDYDISGNPSTFLLTTRMNVKPDGTVPTNEDEGLNNIDFRPVQLYKYELDVPAATAELTRLTKFPILNTFLLPQSQILPSNSSRRMAFNFSLTELGTGNFDQLAEGYYLYTPLVTTETAASFSFATGASRMPVAATASPTPTPSPTATPTATPTPSPTATPTPSPSPTGSPSPSPTPVTPPTVTGISRGMLAIINFSMALVAPIVPRTAVGSLQRSFQLPIELSGVSMTINGVACGLKAVSQNEITFVVPVGIASAVEGTRYPFVINNNGIEFSGYLTIVPFRPDIFTTSPVPGPNGRADARNVTNRVHTTEPYTVTTIKIKGGKRVATVLRIRATGVLDLAASNMTIRIGASTITGAQILTGAVQVEPGIFEIDFQLPSSLNGAGDQPIILQTLVSGTLFSSRLDDTAPKIRFL